MQQDHKYTAADFERYHSGKMSEHEMHALEKAALNDPFLADALEGYVFTNNPVKDIADIHGRLLSKKEEKKVFIIAKQNTWFRIAALFILIAGIGYLAYQLNFNRENNLLAKKGDSSEMKSTAEPIIPKTDTLLPDESTDIAASDNKEHIINKDKNIHSTDRSNSREKSIDKPSEYQRDIVMQKSAAPGTAKDYITMDEKQATGKKEKLLNTEADSTNLDEVTVTTQAIKRSERSAGNVTTKNKQAPQVVADESSSQAVTEFQKLNEYVKKNIRVPLDEAGKSYKGNVVLSFEVNKKGDPKNIKVEQSLCKPCDEEATRLLKQGPKWKYNTRSQFVTIEF